LWASDPFSAFLAPINTKIKDLDTQLVQVKEEINSLDNNIEETKKELDLVYKTIKGKQKLLKERIRIFIKLNQKVNIPMFYSSHSFLGLISKIEVLKRVLDRQLKAIYGIQKAIEDLRSRYQGLKKKYFDALQLRAEIEARKEALLTEREEQIKLLKEIF
jgi:peptidoglycan hydrolase CwlO-like protein